MPKIWPNKQEVHIRNEIGEIPAGNQFIPYCSICHHNHVYRDLLEDRICEHPFCQCPNRQWSKKEYDQVQHDPNCECSNAFLKEPRKFHQKSCPMHVVRPPKYCGCILILDDKEIPCRKKTSHRWDHSWFQKNSGVTIYWTGPDHKRAKRLGESLRKEVVMTK